MSTISAGTTTTTALVSTGDTTGNLILATGATPTTALTLNSTTQAATFAGPVNFASWTTATRPASPAVGQMGYNTTTGLFDQYIAAGWTSVGAAAGSVLQVVQGSTNTSVSTTTDTWVDTGLTASITPKFSTSKILVLVAQNGCSKSNTAANNSVGLRILRGATNLVQFGVFMGYTAGAADGIMPTGAHNYLDSPATTSATTYKTQFNSGLNSGSVSVQNGAATSSITLMEIAG